MGHIVFLEGTSGGRAAADGNQPLCLINILGIPLPHHYANHCRHVFTSST